MSRPAEEEVRGVVGRGRGRAVAVPVCFNGRDRLLVARVGDAHVLTLRLRAVLLGGALECLVDSAHHFSPWPSQRRKARPRSSTPGVAAPLLPPPSSSRSTSRSCRTRSARPTPACARPWSSHTTAP